MDRYVSISIRNVQILTTEMFKIHKNEIPPIFNKLFKLGNSDCIDVFLIFSSKCLSIFQRCNKGPFKHK